MSALLYGLILIFGVGSYLVGLKQMLAGRYRPSVFSRVVWLLLAVISFAGVLVSHSSTASLLLSGIFLAGNASICITSFWKGSRGWGQLEYVCIGILALSVIVWIIFDAPLVGLVISLFAHFVGAAPTYRRVLQQPSSESTGFWSLFFIASLISVVASWGQPLSLIIFPVYFTFFDGSMTLLSSRKR